MFGFHAVYGRRHSLPDLRGYPKPKRPDISKYEATQTLDPDTALRLLEESLPCFTPVPVPKATAQDDEDQPAAA